VKLLRDYQDRIIRFTDERLQHILEHPEMKRMSRQIEETLANPEKVIQSTGDPDASLYYRLYSRTLVGSKQLCVVVKTGQHDAFVVTAYLTDKIKRGEVIWPKKA